MVPPEAYCSMLLGSLCKQPLKHALQPPNKPRKLAFELPTSPTVHRLEQLASMSFTSNHKQFLP